MEDKEIIKALECCKSSVASCEECPMYVKGVICHGYELNKKSLNLILLQQEEIERLKKYNTEVSFKHYNDGIKDFAERLKEVYTSEFISDDYHCAVGVIKQNIDEIVKKW